MITIAKNTFSFFVLETIKVLEPTGISSWEDFAENRQEKGWTDLETYTSFIGSLPYLNKLTKGYKDK